MRKLVVLSLVTLLISCGDDAIGPDSLLPGGGSAVISDAAHGEDRNPGFWWLAPLVPQPALDGSFQPGYSPRVTVVCQHDSDAAAVCDPTQPLVSSTGVTADFTVGSGLVVEPDLFKVEFDTEDFGLRTTSTGDTTTYRILVETDPLVDFGGPFLLGFADFQLGENGGSARNLAVPDSMIGLADGRTLPIKFFINELAYAHALEVNTAGAPGDAALCQINCSVTVIPGGSRGTEASLFDREGFELTSVQFGLVDVTRILVIDERETDGAGANCAPGRASEKENCFRYEVTPTGAFPEDFRFGVCPVGITFGAEIWELVQVESDGTATTHGDVNVDDFLPCTDNDGSGTQVTLFQPLLDLLVRPLYAEDTRVWGGTDNDFSDFFWEVPATMSASSALTGVATPGVPETMTVLVEATHALSHDPPGSAVPLAGAEVTFTVTEGTGTIATPTGTATTVVDTTDGDGLASVAFTAGSGVNTVVASSLDASGGPISFSRIESVATLTTFDGPLPLASVGSPRVLGATVTPAPPVGSAVEFFSDGVAIGNGTTDANGRATLTHTFSSPTQAEELSAAFQGAAGFDPSVSAAVTQHKYEIFQDPASFQTALGGALTETQDFENLTSGSTVTSVIPSVLDATSTFDLLQVGSCGTKCLFGQDAEGNPTRTAGEGRYDLQFTASRNILGFDIVAQNPAAGPATVAIVTAAGSVSVAEGNPNLSESDPNFFGIVLSLPINTASILEGTEVSGTGNEEVGLDNFAVGTT